MGVVMLEAETAIRAGPRARLLDISREVQDPERDARVRDRLAAGIDDTALDHAVVVRRHIEVPGEDRGRDRARHEHEAVEEEPPPERAVGIVAAHPLVAPEVRPRMNSFWASRNRRMPGASTMMTKA